MGDFKELPLTKGIERMMREKVTGDGGGDLQGVRDRGVGVLGCFWRSEEQHRVMEKNSAF